MIKFITYTFVLTSIMINAQTKYTMRLTNPQQLAKNTFQFDISIRSDIQDFNLTSYQCSFSFNNFFQLSDSVKLTYLENSSGLSNYPLSIIGHDTVDGTNEIIFVSGIGNDLITQEEKLVGTFKLSSNKNFTYNELNMFWDFSGVASTILTGGNFTDITDPNNHYNFDNTITSAKSEDIIPMKFELSQNYPNPFNPTTKIDFVLPTTENVKLFIYNILGEKVVALVDEKLSSGKHTINFNANGLASGTYIYVIKAGNFKAVRKMILMK